MDHYRPQHEDKFLVSLSDIICLFRKNKTIIFLSTLVCCLLAMLYALTKPILYEAEGSFRERGIKTSQLSSNSVLQFLGGNQLGGESEAASLLTSRKILNDVVKKLHLQGELVADADKRSLFRLVKQNLWLQWATLTKPRMALLPDICCPLQIASLEYEGELPISFRIEILDEKNYTIWESSHSKDPIVSGTLGEPVVLANVSFALAANPAYKQPLASGMFTFSIEPLMDVVKTLSNQLDVEFSTMDKSLLVLKVENRDRHLASQLINSIMTEYQIYLKKYHEQLAFHQLDYLNHRRDHLSQNLVKAMNTHANYLTEDLSNSGFIESKKEIDFLAKSQYEYKQKLLDNELEIKRLMNVKPNNFVYYDRYSSNDGDPTVINAIFSEMRALKQQRDSLEIEMQKKTIGESDTYKKSFEQQLKELEMIQLYLKELQEIHSQFREGKIPTADYKVADDSRFLLKDWFEKLRNDMGSPSSSNQKNEVRESFQFYLNNLDRLFGVHERILQERLIHQQNPSGDYQGISLEVAKEIYLDYSKQLVNIEGNIRQNIFFIQQIEDPSFEITSLSAGLDDPVSREMISKASQLILNLRDQNNQSLREHGRIQDELQLQRTFLNMHLKQMVQLMNLNKELIDEKIFTLQSVSLELIHQRISLLEKNLKDYIQSRLDNLQQERILIKRQLDSIQTEMSNLPQKWVSEQLLSIEIGTNQLIVEEIVKLVESKNISHNLEVVQSAPVDLAIPSVRPISPKVISWAFIGSFLGASLSGCFILGRAFYTGIRASRQNLANMGFHVAGILHCKENKEENYLALRRMQIYMDYGKSSSGNEALLLLQGHGPYYSFDLADILLNKGMRVLTLDLQGTHGQAAHGLLQYLSGEVDSLPIQKGPHGDWVGMGGESPFRIEMLTSKSFQELLTSLSSSYDCMLVATDYLPCSVEAESLVPLFTRAAVTIDQERIEDLDFYTLFIKNHPHCKLAAFLTKK